LAYELREEFEKSNIKHVLRNYKNEDNIYDLDLTVGPLKKDEEFIMKFKTNINNNNLFFTDDNSLEMLERRFRNDSIQLVASNFYPTQYSSFIKDQRYQLSIIVDRTVAFTSLKNGEIQIMLMRRTSTDDKRGVEEVKFILKIAIR
jgi:hypothetical protein